MSGKQQPPQPTTRKERRAAERSDRFEAARSERKTKTGSPKRGGGSSIINSRTITVAALIVGVLIVVVVAAGQLGNRVTGTFTNPGIQYPASIQHDNELYSSSTAPVTLEVYGDFQCPVCAKSSLDVEPSIVTKYVVPGQVRIIHHDIAILGRPTPTDPANESRIAASGGVCAVAQGKYWDYAHWIFGNQAGENAGEFTVERTTAIAKAAGLDGAAFAACVNQPPATQPVDSLTQTALNMGISSTPTFYVNGVAAGSGLKTVDQLSQMIDAALAASSASPSASGAPAASASPAASGSPAASASSNP